MLVTRALNAGHVLLWLGTQGEEEEVLNMLNISCKIDTLRSKIVLHEELWAWQRSAGQQELRTEVSNDHYNQSIVK